MLRIFFLATILITSLHSFAQNAQAMPLKKKYGMLCFEGKGNVIWPFFIEAPPLQPFSFTQSDTLKLVYIGKRVGCITNDASALYEYLSERFKFDSMMSIDTWEGPTGLRFEDTLAFKYQRGYITYFENNVRRTSYDLIKRKFNNKIVVIERTGDIVIENFFSNKLLPRKIKARR